MFSKSTDWKKGILCQDSTASKGPLVLQPRTDSCQRFLEVVQEWAHLQDGEYVVIAKSGIVDAWIEGV